MSIVRVMMISQVPRSGFRNRAPDRIAIEDEHGDPLPMVRSARIRREQQTKLGG